MMIAIDMEMPENCVECRFNVSEFGYCNAMPVNFCGQVYDFEEQGKPNWCPLKQVDKLVVEHAVSYDDVDRYGTDVIKKYVTQEMRRKLVDGLIENGSCRWDKRIDEERFIGYVRATVCVVKPNDGKEALD